VGFALLPTVWVVFWIVFGCFLCSFIDVGFCCTAIGVYVVGYLLALAVFA